jgi:fibronectin type III domain protein
MATNATVPSRPKPGEAARRSLRALKPVGVTVAGLALWTTLAIGALGGWYAWNGESSIRPHSLWTGPKPVPASQIEGGAPSRMVLASTVSGPPGAPGAPMALAGEASATAYWSAPTGAVSSYTVTASPGGATATVGGSTLSAIVSGLSDGSSYTFNVTAGNAFGTGPASAASNAVVVGRGAYQALVPARILDTRAGAGPLEAGATLNVQVLGQGGVPASGVSAVTLNVTVTDTTAPSFLTVWPAGLPLPLASNLNWIPGKTVPNLVEVAVGAGGQISLYNGFGAVDLVLDVEGYVTMPAAVPPPAGLFNPVVPNRVLDTRYGNGAPAAQVCAGQTISVKIAGTLGIPSSGVGAVALNVTVTQTVVAPSFLTVYPTGSTRPLASNLNFFPGQTVANGVVVKLGTGGYVNFYDNAGHTDIVADVSGWFTDGTTSAGGSSYVGLSPTRLLDTRTTQRVGAATTHLLAVAGTGGVPAMGSAVPPVAVVLNITVTDTTAASYLTLWPDGTTQPLASDLNWIPGDTVPNLIVVKLGADGSIDFYNGFGMTDVIVDVVGWYG